MPKDPYEIVSDNAYLLQNELEELQQEQELTEKLIGTNMEKNRKLQKQIEQKKEFINALNDLLKSTSHQSGTHN